MKGYLWTTGRYSGPEASEAGSGKLQRWESIAVDAVGNVIEFWGFKRNQGRVWGILYLRDEAMTAAEIEDELDLSKGGVSMLLRDLERWGVILRVRSPGDSSWRYRAETDIMRMVTRVLQEREAEFMSRIRADLEEARKLAVDAKAPRDRLQRLAKMTTLAEQTERALRLFLKTAKLDVGGVFSVFKR